MSQCEFCLRNGYLYWLSSITANFNAAALSCESVNGTLARYLNEDDYIKLRECCENDVEYWIGLFENSACRNSLTGPYSWVGNTACTSADPLNVNEKRNRAISVILNSNNPTRPPPARERKLSRSNRFICQYPLTYPTTTQVSLTETSFTDATKFFSTATTSSLFDTTDQTQSPFSTSEKQELTNGPTIPTAYSTLASSTNSAVAVVSGSSGITIGLAVGGTILLITVLALLYFFLVKFGYCKKFKIVSSLKTFSSTPQKQEDSTKEVKDNPLYDRIQSTQESHHVRYNADTENTNINSSIAGIDDTYQMAENMQPIENNPISRHLNNHAVISNEYTSIPGNLSCILNPSNQLGTTLESATINPSNSNEYKMENNENDYSKLHFPNQPNDASLTYASLSQS